MTVDLASLPGWAIGGLVLVTAFIALLTQGRVARLIERWSKTRGMVKIVREQRRMANLALQPDTELRHSTISGSELVIRRSPSAGTPETEREASQS